MEDTPYEIAYNKHWIRLREDGSIMEGFSDGVFPDKSTDGCILLNGEGGYQFCLFPDGEWNPMLFDMDGIPLYKWVDGEVQNRTEEEIQEELSKIPPPPPSPIETAQSDITSMQLALVEIYETMLGGEA